MSLAPEQVLRVGVFALLLVAMVLLEQLRPRRPCGAHRGRRWRTNIGILALSTGLVRATAVLVPPVAAVSAATWAESRGIGLLAWLGVRGWLGVVVPLVVLDLALWAQHVASHRMHWLWRLHRVHHADVDFDATTGVRFHPIEILISALWKAACAIALGAPAAAVLLFEVLLNATALFSHGNVKLGAATDRILRLVIVTPDMHRIHHSVETAEHNSNFGFNLSFWDRLFGTYRKHPAAGHERMEIGLSEWRSEAPTRLGWSLLLPFMGAGRASSTGKQEP